MTIQDIDCDECVFMQQLIIFNHYKICVEIGVRNGRTTHYLCIAAKVNGGHVHGFDLWGQHGLKKQFRNPQDCSQTVVEQFLKQRNHVNFTLNTVDTRTQKFKDLLNEQCPKIDFAFIDACHSYPGLKNDFDIIYPMLSPTGTIAFHDTMRIDGCREFVLDLRTRYSDGSYDIVDFPWGMGTRRTGLTLLIKRQFPIVNLPIDEKCGSLSCPEHIIQRETEWLNKERQMHVPEQIDTSSLIVDTKDLGKIKI